MCVCVRNGREEGGGGNKEFLTAFPVANFFSVATIAPLRWALFRAPLPRTTVSRWLEPPPVLLPILVTVSQSSAIALYENEVKEDEERDTMFLWRF